MESSNITNIVEDRLLQKKHAYRPQDSQLKTFKSQMLQMLACHSLLVMIEHIND